MVKRIHRHHRFAAFAASGLTGVVFVVLALFAGTALATPPTLVSVENVRSQLTARWTLPPGYTSEAIEIATAPFTDPTGSFLPRYFYDFDLLDRYQTSWTTSMPGGLEAGTYYVHVSDCRADLVGCTDEEAEWSNILELVVRGTQRYAGRTSQGKRISFRIPASGKRIKRLKVGVRYRCRINGRRRKLFGTVRQGPREVIKFRNSRFRVSDRSRQSGVRSSFRMKGLFSDGAFHGTLRVRASGPAGTCDTGKVTWKT